MEPEPAKSKTVIKTPAVAEVGEKWLPGIARTFSAANAVLSSAANTKPLHPELAVHWQSLHQTLQTAMNEHVDNLKDVARTVLHTAAAMDETDDRNAKWVKDTAAELDAIPELTQRPQRPF